MLMDTIAREQLRNITVLIVVIVTEPLSPPPAAIPYSLGGGNGDEAPYRGPRGGFLFSRSHRKTMRGPLTWTFQW